VGTSLATGGTQSQYGGTVGMGGGEWPGKDSPSLHKLRGPWVLNEFKTAHCSHGTSLLEGNLIEFRLENSFF
jgi:hypothetical protein